MSISKQKTNFGRTFALCMLVPTLIVIIAVGGISILFNHQYPSVGGLGSIAAYRNSDKWNVSLNFRVLEKDLKAKYPQLNKIGSTDDLAPEIKSAYVELKINSENGRYYWGSYNNIPLNVTSKKIEVSRLLDPQNRIRKNKTRLVIFEAVNGDGLIIIIETPPKKLKKQFWCGYPGASSCDKPRCLKEATFNYIEYKPNGTGGLVPYVGRTDPFPYPNPDTCI